MNSAFFGLHIATSALNTSRANLHTIGHNIANAETPGFSRQVAVQQASTPLRGSGARGMIGTGSQITTISQIRNVAIDKRFWHQSSVLGQFSKKNEIMALTRGILREREDTEGQGLGFNHEFNSIFNRIHQLNVDATSMTNRANLMSAFESLAIHMNNSYASMMQQQIDTNAEIGSMVGIINSLGRQISTLNRQIAGFEMTGANANDLRDQRARLIDELSTYVNIDVQEIETNPDFAAGRISDPSQSRRETIILINGSMFVNHTRLEQLEVRQRQSGVTSVSRNLEEPPGMYDIFWANGLSFNMYSRTLSGQLKGLIDMRDGNGGNHGTAINNPASPTQNPVFTAAASPNPATLRLTFDSSNSRVDFPPAGVIRSTDAAGRAREFMYTSQTMVRNLDPITGDPDGTYTITFEMADDDNLNAAQFGAFHTITVGQSTSYRGIPYFMNRLNILARTWTRALNEGVYMDGGSIPGVTGHIYGWDLQDPPQRGEILFTYSDHNGNLVLGDPTDFTNFNIHRMTAMNFSINPEIFKNPSMLATAGDWTQGESAYAIMESWINLGGERGLFREGRLSDFISSITGELGVVGQQAANFENSYSELVVTIDNQRRSISGVSLDEETAFMIQHQLIFQAAARLINVIDGIYDTLINRLGNW